MPKTTWFGKKSKKGQSMKWHPRIKGQLAYSTRKSGKAAGPVARKKR